MHFAAGNRHRRWCARCWRLRPSIFPFTTAGERLVHHTAWNSHLVRWSSGEVAAVPARAASDQATAGHSSCWRNSFALLEVVTTSSGDWRWSPSGDLESGGMRVWFNRRFRSFRMVWTILTGPPVRNIGAEILRRSGHLGR